MEKLLIASTYLPPIAGGAEQVAWEVGKRIADEFEVHILTTGSRCLKDVEENITIHNIRRLPFLTLVYSSFARYEIDKALTEISPDIVHSHMALPWGYVLRKAKSKRVVTCHGGDIFPKKNYPEEFLLMSALKNANAVTAPSRWLCNYIERSYDVSCTLIPNGVDTNDFRPLEKVRKQDNVVLFVGRFIERKGILDLMEVAKALPEYEFWLVGNPKAKGSVEIPSLPNVKKIGFVNNTPLYYNEATLCVFPSHWENFPMVGLEAMACGKAVVATRVGFSEYIENGCEGILVESGDVKSLIYSIRNLMENENQRRKFEENARKKTVHYDWSIIAKQYIDLYKTI